VVTAGKNISVPPLNDVLWERCRRNFAHFTSNYCMVLSEVDTDAAQWMPFRLWPAQQDVAHRFQTHKLVIALKARQLGLSWLSIAFALWQALFHPIATALLFSRRDDEAVKLLDRLKGMYRRLPSWAKAASITTDNDHEFALSNGSTVMAFPTTAGDSYTASLVLIDEADLVADLDRLLRATKPTIDAGGRMLLVSRVNKSAPESPFKRIYRAARAGQNDWFPAFLPWNARPDRDQAWYAAQQRDALARTGSLDDVHEMYPATEAECLAPRTLDKRLPLAWLKTCYRPGERLTVPGAPALPALIVFAPPVAGKTYIGGGDPAAGNPTSNESAFTIIEEESGEQVAVLAAQLEPSTFAAHIDAVGKFYNQAAVLVERNNHGAAVLLWLRDNSGLPRLKGHDNQEGWSTTTKSKNILFDTAGLVFRDGKASVRDITTFEQLAAVEGSTLEAPPGQLDDRAMSYVLALAGRDALARNRAFPKEWLVNLIDPKIKPLR
jgi:hypothetical protein